MVAKKGSEDWLTGIYIMRINERHAEQFKIEMRQHRNYSEF